MKKKILLVEYATSTIEQIKEVLPEHIFAITIIHEGEAAKRLLEEQKFDLMITAAMLPKFDGFSLSQFAARACAEMKIIITSNIYRSVDTRDQAILVYKANDFFEVPFKNDGFKKRVFELLELDSSLLSSKMPANLSDTAKIPVMTPEINGSTIQLSSEDLFGDIIEKVHESHGYEINLNNDDIPTILPKSQTTQINIPTARPSNLQTTQIIPPPNTDSLVTQKIKIPSSGTSTTQNSRPITHPPTESPVTQINQVPPRPTASQVTQVIPSQAQHNVTQKINLPPKQPTASQMTEIIKVPQPSQKPYSDPKTIDINESLAGLISKPGKVAPDTTQKIDLDLLEMLKPEPKLKEERSTRDKKIEDDISKKFEETLSGLGISPVKKTPPPQEPPVKKEVKTETLPTAKPSVPLTKTEPISQLINIDKINTPKPAQPEVIVKMNHTPGPNNLGKNDVIEKKETLTTEKKKPETEEFNGLEIMGLIGRGGMAEIYKAKKKGPKGFEKIIAFKKILTGYGEDAKYIEMFVDEAKLAAHLSHPNIVQIYDLGKKDDYYFIAMEYVSGKDLRLILQKLTQRNIIMPEELSIYLMLKILEALSYAHSARDNSGRRLEIVHRDISPPNILVSYDGNIKLTDFGVSKASTKLHQTLDGALKGKLMYMSPEQARGESYIDQRSDLYSVGIILFELITGTKLFLSNSEIVTLKKVQEGQIIKPSQIKKTIDPELEYIILKSLQKDMNKRYQKASEMIKELDAYMTKNYDNSPEPSHIAHFLYTLFKEEIIKDNVNVNFCPVPHPIRKIRKEAEKEIKVINEVKNELKTEDKETRETTDSRATSIIQSPVPPTPPANIISNKDDILELTSDEQILEERPVTEIELDERPLTLIEKQEEVPIKTVEEKPITISTLPPTINISSPTKSSTIFPPNTFSEKQTFKKDEEPTQEERRPIIEIDLDDDDDIPTPHPPVKTTTQPVSNPFSIPDSSMFDTNKPEIQSKRNLILLLIIASIVLVSIILFALRGCSSSTKYQPNPKIMQKSLTTNPLGQIINKPPQNSVPNTGTPKTDATPATTAPQGNKDSASSSTPPANPTDPVNQPGNSTNKNPLTPNTKADDIGTQPPQTIINGTPNKQEPVPQDQDLQKPEDTKKQEVIVSHKDRQDDIPTDKKINQDTDNSTEKKNVIHEGDILSPNDIDAAPVPVNKPDLVLNRNLLRLLMNDEQVLVSYLIDHNGNIEIVKIIKKSNISQLNSFIEESIKRWRFKPAMKNNIRVKIWKNEWLKISK